MRIGARKRFGKITIRKNRTAVGWFDFFMGVYFKGFKKFDVIYQQNPKTATSRKVRTHRFGFIFEWCVIRTLPPKSTL